MPDSKCFYMSTTKIPQAQTAGEIQAYLGRKGARQILTEYDGNGDISALSFTIDVGGGRLVLFRLPIRWEKCLEAMTADPKTPRSHCTEEQARRTAWRIALRWVEAQFAFIETRMVSLPEIMLPFAQVGEAKHTFFEQLQHEQFKVLEDMRGSL